MNEFESPGQEYQGWQAPKPQQENPEAKLPGSEYQDVQTAEESVRWELWQATGEAINARLAVATSNDARERMEAEIQEGKRRVQDEYVETHRGAKFIPPQEGEARNAALRDVTNEAVAKYNELSGTAEVDADFLDACRRAGYAPDQFFSANFANLGGMNTPSGEIPVSERVKSGETTWLAEARKYLDRDLNVTSAGLATYLREANLSGEIGDFPYSEPVLELLSEGVANEAVSMLSGGKTEGQLSTSEREILNDRRKRAETIRAALKPPPGSSVRQIDRLGRITTEVATSLKKTA